MRIFFDADAFRYEMRGIPKVTKYLFDACRRIDPTFRAYGLADCDLSEHDSDSIRMIDTSRYPPSEIRRFAERKGIGYIYYPWNGGILEKYSFLKAVIQIHDIIPIIMKDYYPIVRPHGPRDLKHDLDSVRIRHQYKKNMQRDIDRAAMILVDSKYTAKALREHFRIGKMKLLYFAAAMPEYPPSPENAAADDYIIYIGAYEARKGIGQLIKAFSSDKVKCGTDAKLVLVGSKKPLDAETDCLIGQGTAEGRIRELGYVEDRKAAELIRGAQGLFFLSSYEGFGLPVLEGMKLGCPVVTTDRTSIPEVGGDAVMYVTPEDTDAVADMIIRLTTDGDLRRELTEKGYRREALFTWERTAQRFLSFFENA